MVVTSPRLFLSVSCVLCKEKRTFIDSLRLHVKGGPGGMGYPKCGGIGGTGGSIYIEGKKDLTLKNVLKKYPNKRAAANGGQNAHSRNLVGDKGEDLVISVPPGVTAYSQTGVKLGEVNQDGEKVLVASGGHGGCKDNGFCGRKGEAHVVTLDLKLVADVGLIGFPNAGKSSLLKAISNARPKIASYPFTTLQPMLGVVKYPDLREVSVADLPGLIEGAHMNRGMGSRFLKHFERTKVVLMVVDIGGFRLSHEYPHRSCLQTILLLFKELELYNEELLKKPAMLVVNKLDLPGAQEEFNNIRKALKDIKGVVETLPEELRPSESEDVVKFAGGVIGVSAKDGSGIEELKRRLRFLLQLSVPQDYEEKEMALMKALAQSMTEKGPRVI